MTAFFQDPAVFEQLKQVVKHASVQQAQVYIKTEDDVLVVQVIDQGAGFEVDRVLAIPHPGGYGLLSIHDRLTLFGGQLTLASTIGVGTEATIRLPLTPTDTAIGAA